MKFLKKRDYNGSIRKVWSDDKEVCFGVVGTVGDLLKEGIFEYADYSPEAPDRQSRWDIHPLRRR